jgi:hypothetical protein
LGTLYLAELSEPSQSSAEYPEVVATGNVADSHGKHTHLTRARLLEFVAQALLIF